MSEQRMMRLAVDAVIEREGKLLLIEYEDVRLGRYWGLPGGGVDPGETLHATLRREVWEETGALVTVGHMLMVNEYDPAASGYLYDDELTLRLLFHCTLAIDAPFTPPTVPDPDQIGVDWVAIAELTTVPFYPRIAKRLQQLLTATPIPDLFIKEL